MRIRSLDHLVLMVADIDATMNRIDLEGRVALRFGAQKLNLHRAGAEVAPHAAHPTRGSADICLLVSDSPDQIAESLARAGIPVELGPVGRTGATSALASIYVRDPDGNLVELSQTVDS